MSPKQNTKTKRKVRKRTHISTRTSVRAEALCLSPLDLSVPAALSPRQIRTAVADILTRCGGPAGVAGDFAFEYGEHPDLAIARMRQALAVVRRRNLWGRR